MPQEAVGEGREGREGHGEQDRVCRKQAMVGEANDGHGAAQSETKGANDGEIDETPAICHSEVRPVEDLAAEVGDGGESEPIMQ